MVHSRYFLLNIVYTHALCLIGFERGHMVGHWPLAPGIDFPYTVAAVGLADSGNYDWFIEFICNEIMGKQRSH